MTAALLRQHGIRFESRKGGLHLVIRHDDRTFDFWPSSGRFRERDRSAAPGSFAVHRTSVRAGCGIAELISAIKPTAGVAA